MTSLPNSKNGISFMHHFSSSTTKKCHGRDRFGHLIPFAPQIQDGWSWTMVWVGGGGGCASRSPEEVFEGGYFFWALLCIKRDSISGIQDFFDGQIINTKGLRNLGQWQQLEGSVNTHRKKQCLVSESITQKLEARREGLERLYCDWSGENR